MPTRSRLSIGILSIAIEIGQLWIGVGTTYLSSASARVIDSARPKSSKELKQPSFCVFRSRRCQNGVHALRQVAGGADTPRGRAVDRKACGNRAENLAEAAFRTRGPSDTKSERAGDMAYNCRNCKASSWGISRATAANPLKKLRFWNPVLFRRLLQMDDPRGPRNP